MPTHPRFHACCVGWNPDDVNAPGGLCDMIEAGREVTAATFRRRIGAKAWRTLEASLGYDRMGLRLAGDPHVRFRRSRLHGIPVYYLVHSAIEHVFVPADARLP